jgi:SAM-dependent methyltransferase
MTSSGPQQHDAPVATWHYGVMARWWAHFHVGGPELGFFERFVADGQPALDVACGTGRLLVPYVQHGYDVDGCDVSPDMLTHCRDAAARVGKDPALFAQAIHQLDVPRRYRTIFICGAFGLGTTREQDREALRRLWDHVEPGGRLLMDIEAPYADAETWARWADPHSLPEPEPDLPRERRRGPDGCDYAVVQRLIAVDPLEQVVTREMRAWQWRDGELLTDETHRLTERVYLRNELVTLLEVAGFTDISVVGGYHGGPPRGDEQFLVYIASRPLAE